jgi:hypothetical protein
MVNLNDVTKKWLGWKVKDKIHGLEGIVTSVSVDLFGCIQADVHTGHQADGKPMETRGWYDLNRLELKGKTPVMEPVAPRDGEPPGPSDKPRGMSR